MAVTPSETLFDLGDRQIAARVWGDPGGRKVLAIHGWLDNAASFDRLLPQMPGVHTVAIDLVGHGLSSHRPAGTSYHLMDNLVDIVALLDHLGWKRFSLLGHSLGAAISCLLASALNQRVERLGLIDGLGPLTVPATEAPKRLAVRLDAVGAAGGGELRVYPDIDTAAGARIRGFGRLSIEAARILVTRGLAPCQGGYVWRTDRRLRQPSPVYLTESQVTAFLQNIDAPVCLVLAGSGLFASHKRVRERISHVRDIEVQEIPGDHHLHLEAPAAEVASLLHRFFLQPVRPQEANQVPAPE